MAVVMVVQGDPPDLGEAVATQVYRIVQEALTNVVRHAQAHTVELHMRSDAGVIGIDVLDDGCGIDFLPRRAGAIGLFSMAERAREIGATVDVQRRASGGTSVRISLPAAQPREETME